MKKISRKKLWLALISAILIACILISYFVLPYVVIRKLPKTAVLADKEQGILSAANNDFKILQLTDLHINGKIEMSLTFSIMKKAIYTSQPDLIVITGDVFSNPCSKEDVQRFCDFMAQLGILWTVVLGNHDDETDYSMEELSQVLEHSEGSLFKRGDLQDRYGNYYYYLSFPDGNTQQLIFMDSRSSGFTEEGFAFYEAAVLDSVSFDGKQQTNNLLFYHIPLPELTDALRAYSFDSSIGSGQIGELPCLQETSEGFFDMVVELGRTRGMFFGHDHLNNTIINYKNVAFCYGTKTGIAGGHNFHLGGNLITLQSDGQFTVERLLHWG